MINFRYIFMICLLSTCIYGLFQVKFKVQTLHHEHAELKKQLISEKDNIHVLKAEWSYLNHPDRLQRLTEKFLTLQEVKVEQVKIARSGKILLAEKENVTPNLHNSTNQKLVKISYNLQRTALVKTTPNTNLKANSKTKWRYKERPVLKARSK